VGTKGVVAAGHPETAKAAAEILAAGGTVVDAALAGLAVACVAEPVLASLGGGGFLLVHDARAGVASRPLAYDFFVQTPCRPRPADYTDLRAVEADFGVTRQTFHIGLGSVATPGVVKGLFAAHRDLGRIPIRQLVEPATALARSGVRVDSMQARIFRIVRSILQDRPDTVDLFASPLRPGELIGEGEVLRMPDLADALEILAVEGDDLFYRGEMGRQLVTDCAAHGGHLTRQDLEGYDVERRAPLIVERFGARFALNPPPAVGGLLVGLGLSLMPVAGLGSAGFGTLVHLQRLVRVLAAIDDERHDRRIHALPPDEAEACLDPARIAALSGRLDAPASRSPVARRGTTHISVADEAGNAAALTVSNGSGSGYLLPGTGILFNNMLGEDDINPDGIGRWPADRRMGSMMAPTLVDTADGRRIALGSGGSNRIRSAVLQVLLNLQVFTQPLAVAVASPRLHRERDTLSVEPGFDERVIDVLAAEAETVERWDHLSMFFGGVHAAMCGRGGLLDASADARRGGGVAAS
jgi:Gamma-glutamyltransferase